MSTNEFIELSMKLTEDLAYIGFVLLSEDMGFKMDEKTTEQFISSTETTLVSATMLIRRLQQIRNKVLSQGEDSSGVVA